MILKCSALIILLIEFIVTTASKTVIPTNKHVTKKPGPKTADELSTRCFFNTKHLILDVPLCSRSDECVYGGVCVKDRFAKGRCMCSSGCALRKFLPAYQLRIELDVPVQCDQSNPISCLTMGEMYTEKYDMLTPMCYRVDYHI